MTSRDSTGEAILFEGPCHSMRGRLATVGRVEVRVGSVGFEPSLLDRLAGAKAWSMPPSELTRMELLDPTHLELSVGDVSHTLQGRAVEEIEHSIRRALVLDPKARAKRPTLAPAERVVLVIPARVTSAEGLRCGTLTVTTTRIYFAHAGIDRIEGGPVGFDVRLDQVRDIHFDGRKGAYVTLVVDRGELTIFEVSTPRAASVFAVLCGLDERTALHQGGFRTHEVTLVTAGERVPGLLAVTRHLLRFEPAQGAFGTLIEIPLAEVSRVERDAGRLVVRHALQRWSFEVELVDRAFDELVRLLAELHPRGEPRADDVGCYDAATIERLVAAHGLQILGFTPGRIAIGGPAVIVTAREGARRGALLLAELGSVFLPFGDGTEPRLVTQIDTLRARPDEEDPTHGVFEHLVNEVFEVFPYGGGAFLERFRLRLRRLADSNSLDQGPSSDRLVDSERSGASASASGSFNRRRSYRAHPRSAVRTMVTPLREGVPAEAQDARLTDLSADGCRLVSDRPIDPCATVEIDIRSTTPPPSLYADIVYSTPPTAQTPVYSYGLRFVKRTPEQERRLRELWMEYQRRELELYRGK